MLASGEGGGGEVTKNMFFRTDQKKFSGHIKYFSTTIRKFCRTYQKYFPNITSFAQRYNNFFRTSKFFRNFYVLPECRIDFCPPRAPPPAHTPMILVMAIVNLFRSSKFKLKIWPKWRLVSGQKLRTFSWWQSCQMAFINLLNPNNL
jgi:hypothetical protein